jgi:Flp pilus assembly protein TadD
MAMLALFLVLTGSALAAGSDEQYLDIYNEILQADALLQSGHSEAAALRYLQAQTDLQKLQTEHPTWNPDIVKFRLEYLAEKLQPLGKFLPATNAPTAAVPAPLQPAAVVGPSAAVQPSVAAMAQQIAGLQEQIRSLTGANAELEGKLKEALSVQPAAVSPAELAGAEARIIALEKERDLLAVALDQEKAAHARAVSAAKTAAVTPSKTGRSLAEADQEIAALKARAGADEKKFRLEIARLNAAAAESEKKLAAANKELELLRAARPAEAQPAEGAKQIPEERDLLKQQLAEISKDQAEIVRLKEALVEAEKKLAAASSELDSLKAARPAEAQSAEGAKAAIEERDKLKEELAQRSKDLADAEAHSNQELLRLRAALQQAGQQRDALKLAAAPPEQPARETAPATAPARPENPQMEQQVEQLQARIAVLEADPVPYTAEELALLKMSPAATPVATPAEPPKTAPPARHVYSSQDLPPGAGALWAEALRASMEHDYAAAEQKFNEVLRQDETNVYVLDHLAEAQLAAGHPADSEASVQRARSLDPDDPASLYLLGFLRYRQERLDEALDALSRSAMLNPTNTATQNFLGCVLAEKGLRPAAETALRKALQSDPDNADAHFNLAVVYAGNKPPSLELALWHYKRAVALGHAKSATLEKLLAENP